MTFANRSAELEFSCLHRMFAAARSCEPCRCLEWAAATCDIRVTVAGLDGDGGIINEVDSMSFLYPQRMARRMSSKRLLILISLLLAATPAVASKQIAITLDDLPYVGESLDDATRATRDLLAALERHDAQASVFVEGGRVEVDGESAQRIALIRRWRDAGHLVANHGYAHPAFNDTPLDAYLADVDRGQAVVRTILDEGQRTRPSGATFFRAPFNQTGATRTNRDALLAHLADAHVRLAPFTVEHADWLFNDVYSAAIDDGDSALAKRVTDAYLAQLDRAMDFAESLAQDTFDRPIPHVLLIHANRINADHLGTMLDHLRDRGYTFVSMPLALEDSAYAGEDTYVGRWGISWLHRWRATKELRNTLRDEPEPPTWIMQAHEALKATRR